MTPTIATGLMREPLSVLIFGDPSEGRLIALKCTLLKCGLGQFVSGRLDECGRCTNTNCERVGLFIVSRESLAPPALESISQEASRRGIPILHL